MGMNSEKMVGFASSPRKLSLTRERASVSFAVDEHGEGRIEQQKQERIGAKVAEVYGFVGAISTMVGFGIFIIWAYFPDAWLHALGITYYPDKYWATAVPAFVLVTVTFVVVMYVSLNFMATPHPESLNTLYDEFTRTSTTYASEDTDADQPIHPISDIPITLVNDAIFL